MLVKNLKKILEEKEMSISELSRKTDIPKSTLMTWLAGRTPDLLQLDKVAQYLGTNIESLAFGRKQEDIFSELMQKVEIHTGLYEISVKKVTRK
ncbi:MAG: helix-turn-helix transcriptional regulator [Bacteriovorax sp.]|nr:helix-turn-helix transcriptional regulator [Bacteriovorax sp.]